MYYKHKETCDSWQVPLVSHQQSLHYWLIREGQFGPMLLKYQLQFLCIFCIAQYY